MSMQMVGRRCILGCEQANCLVDLNGSGSWVCLCSKYSACIRYLPGVVKSELQILMTACYVLVRNNLASAQALSLS